MSLAHRHHYYQPPPFLSFHHHNHHLHHLHQESEHQYLPLPPQSSSYQPQHSIPPSPSPPSSPYTSTDLISQLEYQALDLSYAHLPGEDGDVSSRQTSPYDQSFADQSGSQLMPSNLVQTPRFRLQSSTPNHGHSTTAAHTPPPMSEGSYYSQPAWINLPEQAYLSSPVVQPSGQPSYHSHKRLPSESSVGSAGPNSPYTQTSSYPHIVDPDSQTANSPHFDPYDAAYSLPTHSSKALFAPNSGSFTNANIFNNTAFQNTDSGYDAASVIVAQNARRQAMAPRRPQNLNGLQASQGAFGPDYDTSSDLRNTTPSLDRTTSNAYEDELYNPSMAPSAQTSQHTRHIQSQGSTSMLSPSFRSVFNDRLLAANTARSASPASSVARERSPFRDSSEFAAYSNPSSPDTRVTSAAQMRLQQKLESDAQVYAQHHPPPQHEYPAAKTISPKEALLDYNESEDDESLPLFPQVKPETDYHPSGFTPHDQSAPGQKNESSSAQGYTSARRQSSNPSSSQPAQSAYPFMPPNTVPQQYPFISLSRRQNSSMQSNSDQIPDFPASLTSMESTKSESGAPEVGQSAVFASQESSQTTPPPRPLDTTAHSGSYTCTASSCTARFDTSARLQKHRREAHRTSPLSASTPATPSSATSSHHVQSAADAATRNNHPGPHKCEKINPSTGKPCETIFSRSYDLTRHEDTIHNGRKQKVRCDLCTEEKTFSRNDALTRHMRVVHPDVDYPGKTRRGRS